jgi:hypothetical protein
MVSAANRHTPPTPWIFPRISVLAPFSVLYDPIVLPSTRSTRAQCHGVAESALSAQLSALSSQLSALSSQRSAVNAVHDDGDVGDDGDVEDVGAWWS